MILTLQVNQMAKILGQLGWYKCIRLLPYAYGQHMNVLKTFYMSYMDVGSGLRGCQAQP